MFAKPLSTPITLTDNVSGEQEGIELVAPAHAAPAGAAVTSADIAVVWEFIIGVLELRALYETEASSFGRVVGIIRLKAKYPELDNFIFENTRPVYRCVATGEGRVKSMLGLGG